MFALRKLSIKIYILPNLIYIFKTISVKVLAICFEDTDELILKVYGKAKDLEGSTQF